MLRFFRKAPKLEAVFHPTIAIARELSREVEVAGELILRNLGGETEVSSLAIVLIAGGTRRIDLELPAAWQGQVRLAAAGELRERVAWKQKLAAPMRAPAAEIQIISTEGGKHTPLATTSRFSLGNE